MLGDSVDNRMKSLICTNKANASFININPEYSVGWGNDILLLFSCTSPPTELKYSRESKAKKNFLPLFYLSVHNS